MKKQLMIAGPTASGKSSLAVLVAEKTGGEIISADSRQCYRQIDKGTAKPTPAQLQRVPHHNISNLDLTENDSAADFVKRSKTWSGEIEARGNRVIYSGGSTLHLQSIIHPLDDIPSADPENVRQLNLEAESEGLKSLYKRLQLADPQYASDMDGLNRQRIIRALDVYMQTGRPFSSFHKTDKPRPPENLTVFLLHHPRKELHQRINRRAEEMIRSGLVEETRQLLEQGYSPDLQALRTVGYRQVIEHLQGKISYEQMVKDIKTATRRYAKRQITWFRKWDFAHVFDMSEYTEEAAAETIQHRVAAVGEKG